MRSFGSNLCGTTLLYSLGRETFFQPFESFSDFSSRAISLLLAPVISTGLSACLFLKAGFHLLQSVGNLGLLDFESAGERFVECGESLVGSGMFVWIALIGIASNIVDFMGSLVTSCLSDDEEKEWDPSTEMTPGF